MAGLYGKPSGKASTPSVYPYGQGSEVVGRDKGKGIKRAGYTTGFAGGKTAPMKRVQRSTKGK
jgi:hypothetical protein